MATSRSFSRLSRFVAIGPIDALIPKACARTRATRDIEAVTYLPEIRDDQA